MEVICFGTENPSGGKTTCSNIFAGFEVFAKHANELCDVAINHAQTGLFFWRSGVLVWPSGTRSNSTFQVQLH